MNIQTTNAVNFNAKIISNESYNNVLKYAIEHNKYERLLETLDRIDKIRKDTFIQMDICYTKGYPTVVFSRYEPVWNKFLLRPSNKYVLKRQVDYVSSKNENPLKYALRKFFKLGNNAPHNKMFQEIVLKKDTSKKTYSLF